MIISFSACSSDDPLVPSITVPTGTENYFGKNIDFETSAAEKNITFNANMDWKVEIPQNIAWCKVSPQSGGAGTQNVKISVSDNDTYDDHSTVLRFSVGDSTKTIIVNQKQLDALTLTADKFEIPQEGGTIDVEVKSNIDFTYSIPDEYKTWIHAASTRGGTRALTSHHLAFTIDASEEYEKREGQIVIKSNNKEEIINVYQGGGGLLTLTSNEIAVGSEGGTAEVVVNSNFDFDVEMPNVDWLQKVDASMSRAISSHVIKFNVAENTTIEERNAIVRIFDKNSSLSETVKIIQEKGVAIKFASPSIELMEEGAEKLKYTNNLKDKKVTFKSSNPEIATVSEEGMVKAISRGKATITIVSADGQYSDNCEVIVKNIVDYLEASCLGCNGVVINGLIQSGSKLNWSLINKSNVDIVLKSLQLVDGVTGSAGNEMDVEDKVPAGQGVSYTVTIGRLGIYAPVTCRYKIKYNNKTYIVEAVYKNSLW
ncbi:MAG TPA: hypothetical protein DDW28_04200 [Prevotella sp.]|nr:hypothetical protein [Candidatus Segatella violae]